MAAENLLINNCSDRQTIKTVGEGLPELYVEPALAWGKGKKKDNFKIRLFTSELIFLGEIYFLFGEEEVEQNSFFWIPNVITLEEFMIVSLDKYKTNNRPSHFQDNCSQCTRTYTHHRSHRCGWWRHTHGSPWARRSFLGIWSCRRAAGRWSPATASLYPHNPPGKDSSPPEGSHHTRIASTNLCTDRGCHLEGQHYVFSHHLLQ